MRSRPDQQDGSVQIIQHKIPGAPDVNWQLNVKGVGEFTNGRYAQLKSTGFASINNKTSEGRCTITAQNIAPINLFNGQPSKTNFYSDYFALNNTITSHSGDELVIGFTCSNSGGSTSVIKRWDISVIKRWDINGKDILLIESTVISN
ncbi:hypothetical protein [Motilimonas pumila]|uniref:Uncharacterized protein n=1 Tax=Motilimonas pumila TaxID=2303987 RepID=A0A418YEQ5_9GAMM|nr:hypothetical protein [Motilimonas pumila]RJG47671.1 hypothetical protein D1Z90_09665 [Motilimonas pumila]